MEEGISDFQREDAPPLNSAAAYIMERLGPMTTMKLHKLLYYCQAWHLVWDRQVLFNDQIQAWAEGPVIPALYRKHRGAFVITEGYISGAQAELAPNEVASIDGVLKVYGKLSAQKLSERTHAEFPWIEARRGIAIGEPSTRVITHSAMREYYAARIGRN